MVSLLLLSGCTAYQEQPPSDISNPEISPTNETTKTVLPSPTNSATPTPVLTLTPTLSPTPTLTPIPIETLTTDQLLSVMNVLDGTSSCSLPCWNGITPGLSDKDQLIGFFTRLGYEDTNLIREDVKLVNGWIKIELRPNYSGGALEDPFHWIFVTWNNSVVNRLELDPWDHPEQYTIEKLEEKFGIPNEIKIVNGTSDMRYLVMLSYEEFHTVFKIWGDMEQRLPNNEPLPFCVNVQDHSKQVVDVILYSEEIKDEVMGEFAEIPWEDWAEDLDISTEVLFNRLKTNECIPHP